MSEHRRVLILCTGNSCRSQMAGGWINHELGDTWLARSAGTDPAARVNALAVRAMAEVGIDISKGVPEAVDRYLDPPWDLVITVCDSAKETCPVFSGLHFFFYIYRFFKYDNFFVVDQHHIKYFRDSRAFPEFWSDRSVIHIRANFCCSIAGANIDLIASNFISNCA